MDLRNSKQSLLAHIKVLENRLERVFEAGEWGIYHVGAANYREREVEAIMNLHSAMYDADDKQENKR